ncbi:hypothetical protein ACFPM7_11320 [Actinokineospora guangxiensis]|uniref:Uncharacterized protein n=1 Tax=Actinokineospora guangxiensis TaxID=1490288 RepID=A0ABW0ENW3_9PSEU
MRADLVPYIASWTGEVVAKPDIVEHPSGLGIAFRDEQLIDRDSRGVLWDRYSVRQGEGTPRYADIHPARQRRAMRVLLCQVCGGQADTTPDGVLWLLPAESTWPGWPSVHGVSGLRYRAALPHPVVTGQVTVSHADPAIRWVLATKLVRVLDECDIL